MVYNIRYLETVLNFSKKFFLGLMYPFSCVLWAKMPQKLIPNHRTINSKQLLDFAGILQVPGKYVFRMLF